MAKHPSSPRPNSGQPDRRALLEAFQNVVRDEKQKGAPHVKRPAPGAQTNGRLVLGALAVAFLGVLLLRPAWLFPTPEPETPALKEASLRVRMYVEISRIEKFRADSGHPPASLREAGADTTGLVYTVAEDGYTLTGSNAGQTLTFRSGGDPRQFLGESYRQIAARRKS